jgi:chemotaxis protein methyltransferase CheR
MNTLAIDLDDKHFNRVCSLVYQFSGIHLKKGKEALVKTRLMKRLRILGITSFKDYIHYVESEEGHVELGMMIDVMTTNKTSFFREQAHFDFLSDTILPQIRNRKIRIWSAACSSGQEPYSIAMLLREKLADVDSMDVRILATDISRRMLEEAQMGVYDKDKLGGIAKDIQHKYFSLTKNGNSVEYKIKDSVRKMISLASMNLLGRWPMKGLFDVIFCRNVMIYFDHPTQQKLVDRFWTILEPEGYLFVGHSEGLSAVKHKFKYIQAAIYQK